MGSVKKDKCVLISLRYLYIGVYFKRKRKRFFRRLGEGVFIFIFGAENSIE